MAWDEWERLKSGSGSGGGRPDLVARQDDLGAVGHEAFVLHRALTDRANVAGSAPGKSGSCTSSQAAAALKSHHFTMGAALETTVTRWTSQLSALLQACAHVSNHLDHTRATHAQDDAKIKAALRGIDSAPAPPVPVSRLSEYFK
ncbi:hypothetical protein [Streptomyces sp. NPDC051561]|uniref:hypothetical protein n=1 Tax=Streptomyces sp. NPDC051561 TaxID=3365658 RepID=UPI00379EECE0